MNPTKTVIYGEASESDSEEISLGEDDIHIIQENRLGHDGCNVDTKAQKSTQNQEGRSMVGDNSSKDNTVKADISSSILASISSVASLAKLANYSSYNLLTSAGPFATSASKPETKSDSVSLELANLSLLHRTLYAKNQQLVACLTHLQRHPYEKAAKDFHSISQNLVGVQKAIQDTNNSVIKLKKEKKNLDFDLRMIS